MIFTLEEALSDTTPAYKHLRSMVADCARYCSVVGPPHDAHIGQDPGRQTGITSRTPAAFPEELLAP
jgi:hypothetical protein